MEATGTGIANAVLGLRGHRLEVVGSLGVKSRWAPVYRSTDRRLFLHREPRCQELVRGGVVPDGKELGKVKINLLCSL